MTEASTPTRVDFHFDVICPWAYQTSHWMREVRDRLGLEVDWRFFSLEEVNRLEGKKHPWEREWSYGWSMMRVGALLKREDPALNDAWYLKAGTALHVEGRKPHEPAVARALLAEMDLDPGSVDEALADMDEAPDHRSVIIHAQLMRADQLDRAAELNIVPSFFAAHTFFWGDWHRRSFGEERGNNVSPVRWAIDRGVHFTVHNDASIVPPDIMRLVSITVNRTTRSGHVLGPHQRATIQEALHAVTLGAAYQYFEEDTKGSITVGKQADLVILETNPLTTDPAQLEDIQILETFSRGRSVHQR